MKNIKSIKIGTKVKFINGDFKSDIVNEGIKLPKVNESYTVRGFDIGGNLLLEEIKNPLYKFPEGISEFGFSQERFIILDEISEKSLQTVDEILDKISESGINSLTKEEK